MEIENQTDIQDENTQSVKLALFRKKSLQFTAKWLQILHNFCGNL